MFKFYILQEIMDVYQWRSSNDIDLQSQINLYLSSIVTNPNPIHTDSAGVSNSIYISCISSSGMTKEGQCSEEDRSS